MVHVCNLEYLLRNGMCTQNHLLADPNYINIGDGALILDRHTHPVGIIPPGGNLGDYVPFYFWGHSPMLYRIKTGHNVQKRSQADIIFVICSIVSILEYCPGKWCFTDGHAKKNITKFFNSEEDLDKVDWETTRMQIWKNCEEDMDRMRRKQAEFLVKDYVSVACITKLAVYDQQRKEQVEALVRQLDLEIPVIEDTKRQLYYP